MEANPSFQRRLVADLKAAGPYTVTVVRTGHEACQILSRQPHDLALIPLGGSPDLIDKLRAVQPDLPLVLLADETDLAVGETVPETAQALLFRSCLETDLSVALQEALSVAPSPENDHGRDLELASLPALETSAVNQLLLEVDWPESIKAALLLENEQPIAGWGNMDSQTAQLILERLNGGKTLLERGASLLQVQFIELPAEERMAPFVLWIQPVGRQDAARLLLALVALPRTTVAELNNQAGVVARRLSDLITGSATAVPAAAAPRPAPETTAVAVAAGSKTFAVVWRASLPLSDSVQDAIGSQLDRLAEAHGCLLRHSLVRSDLVHLVVTCPPGRNAAWAVHLFKHGLLPVFDGQEAALQAGVAPGAVPAWARGYYAIDAREPLSEAELNLFLEQDRSR
jgi:CheY-like chemotaxis protein